MGSHNAVRIDGGNARFAALPADRLCGRRRFDCGRELNLLAVLHGERRHVQRNLVGHFAVDDAQRQRGAHIRIDRGIAGDGDGAQLARGHNAVARHARDGARAGLPAELAAAALVGRIDLRAQRQRIAHFERRGHGRERDRVGRGQARGSDRHAGLNVAIDARRRRDLDCAGSFDGHVAVLINCGDRCAAALPDDALRAVGREHRRADVQRIARIGVDRLAAGRQRDVVGRIGLDDHDAQRLPDAGVLLGGTGDRDHAGRLGGHKAAGTDRRAARRGRAPCEHFAHALSGRLSLRMQLKRRSDDHIVRLMIERDGGRRGIFLDCDGDLAQNGSVAAGIAGDDGGAAPLGRDQPF